jgi:hypothetical protein
MAWGKVANIKGPPGTSGTGAAGVVGEVPPQTPNGTLSLFSVAYAFVPESLCVYVNGIRQRKAIDFIVISDTQFQFTSPPLAGDHLQADYNPQ